MMREAKRQGMMTVPHGIDDCMALADECLDNYFCQDFITMEANLLRLKKENPCTYRKIKEEIEDLINAETD